MANEKLYPPQINGTLPAFYKNYNPDTGLCTGAEITIPYSMNQSVSEKGFDGFVLKMKTVQTGTYLFSPIYSYTYDVENNTVSFFIEPAYAEKINEGQYYKVQLAYFVNQSHFAIDLRTGEEIEVKEKSKFINGYFSTVGVIKCISKPSVSIKGFYTDSVNLFQNEIYGLYSVENTKDPTETVYSYNFKFYDENNELYWDSGEIIHDSSTNAEYGTSTDILTLNNFVSDNKVYSLVYQITTINGYVGSSPRYKVTSDDLLPPTKQLTITASGNYEDGYVKIGFYGLTELKTFNKGTDKEYTKEVEQPYFGQYLLSRASEDSNFTEWLELKRFRLENSCPSTVSFNDFSIKQGTKYIYSIQQYNMWGLYSSRILSDYVSVDFEDMYLYDGERSLKIKFNPKVSSFKTTLLEQKVDTIGNKYPFIFRNGNVKYKEFPISGLISYKMDDSLMFYDREVHEYIRNKSNEGKNDIDENKVRDILYTDPNALNEYNIFLERDFKLQVLDWLNDGKPKLFRSATEGNYIVRLMNVNLQPVDTLGRMLHSFTCNAYEIADLNYKNLIKYGFIGASNVSDYVSLWRTYNLNDYNQGKDIEIVFDSEVSRFLVQDMFPGDIIKILYFDSYDGEPEQITIGITGSYLFESSSRKAVKIIIPNTNKKAIGIIECQYKGIRYAEFDAVKSLSLKTILSNQYIGVNPILKHLIGSTKNITPGKDLSESPIYNLNIRTLFNDYAREKYSIDNYSNWWKTKLKDKNFIPGDIIQYINSDFFGGKKFKINILNLEQLHIRRREVYPIYEAPYEYIDDSYWESLPDEIKVDEVNSFLRGEDGKYTSEQYNNSQFPINYKFYYISLFDEPYPFDELIPKMKKHYNMNDPYPLFHLMQYNADTDEWNPRSDENYVWNGALNILNIPGSYYDPHWNILFTQDDYDTKYFIDDDEYKYFEVDYNNASMIKRYINYEIDPNGIEMFSNLYRIDENEEYQPIEFTYELVNGIPIEEIIERASKKETYDNIENELYHSNIYLQVPNGLDLEIGKEVHYDNLGPVKCVKIGTGLTAEATFQLEILDYFTEEHSPEVAKAKQIYVDAATFLRNLYRSYEIVAEADDKYQKYLTLYRFYQTMLAGENSLSTNGDNVNSYYSTPDLQINYHDRTIMNKILNFDSDQIKYEFRDKSISDEEIEEIKELLSYIDANELFRNSLKLSENELNDLNQLIENPHIESINDKASKTEEILNIAKATIDDFSNQITQADTNLSNLISQINSAIATYNAAAQKYKADLWIAELIDRYLADENYDSSTNTILEDIQIYYKKINAQEEASLNLSDNIKTQYISDYIKYFNSISSHLSNVSILQKVIQDQDNDDVLDEHLTSLIIQELKNILIELNYLRILKENLNLITGNDINSNNYLEYISDSPEVYDINEVIKLINKNIKLFTNASIKFIRYVGQVFSNAYNIYNNILINSLPVEEGETMSSALKDQVINFISKNDELQYIKEGFELLDQNIFSLIEQDIYTTNKNILTENNYNIMLAYKNNELLAEYLLVLDSAEITTILNNRIIYKGYNTGSGASSSASHNNKFYDGFPEETFTQKAYRIKNNLASLLMRLQYYIDKKHSVVNTGYATDEEASTTIKNIKNLNSLLVEVLQDGYTKDQNLIAVIDELNKACSLIYFYELMNGQHSISNETLQSLFDQFATLYSLNRDFDTVENQLGNDWKNIYSQESIQIHQLSNPTNTEGQPVNDIQLIPNITVFNLESIPSSVQDYLNSINNNIFYYQDINNSLPDHTKKFLLNFNIIDLYYINQAEFDLINANFVNKDNQEIETGLYAWYKKYVIESEKNYYTDLYNESYNLYTVYQGIVDEYTQKRDYYLDQFNEYVKIYSKYVGTEVLKYYRESQNKKEELMARLSEEVKIKWSTFVLKLDEWFLKEYEGGLYR